MEAIQAFLHNWAPHSKAAVYFLAVICSLLAILVVYVRCHLENNGRHLENGWLVRTAAAASPIPIYCMMLVAPLDPDMIQAMMEDQVVVAIAGLYGLVETIKDIRYTGRQRPR